MSFLHVGMEATCALQKLRPVEFGLIYFKVAGSERAHGLSTARTDAAQKACICRLFTAPGTHNSFSVAVPLGRGEGRLAIAALTCAKLLADYCHKPGVGR